MNKKIITIVSGVVIALVLGIGIYQSDASQANPQLTIDEVSDLVTNQYPGVITEIELDKDDGRVKYEIEIDDGNKKYELDIDADTGEVLKIKEKAVTGNEKMKLEDETSTNNDDAAEEKTDTATEETKDKPKQATKEKSKEKSSKQSNTMIDAKQAIDIALNEFSGTVTDLELDSDDGRLLYEIEIKDGKEEAEIEIDAYTGEILIIEIEND